MSTFIFLHRYWWSSMLVFRGVCSAHSESSVTKLFQPVSCHKADSTSYLSQNCFNQSPVTKLFQPVTCHKAVSTSHLSQNCFNQSPVTKLFPPVTCHKAVSTFIQGAIFLQPICLRCYHYTVMHARERNSG